MASLGITNSEIKANAATVLGISRTPTEWDDTMVSDIDRIFRIGRRRLFASHDWSFLKVEIAITTAAPLTTGTAACTSGVVTLTGAPNLPSDLVTNYQLVPNEGGLYKIASRDSDTQFTLDDTSVTFTSQTYSLYKYRYDMPSNFAAWIDPIHIENRQQIRWLNEYHTIPDYIAKRAGQSGTIRTGEPESFAVTQTVASETGVPSFYLEVYPLPTSVQVLRGRIRIQPGDSLTETGEVFHPVFSELMQEAVLSAAEIMMSGQPGVHTQMYQQMLPEAIKQDNLLRGTRRLPERDPFGRSMFPPNYFEIIAPVTWETL